MKINNKIMMLMALSMGVPSVVAAQDSDSTSLSDQTLNEVVVTHRQTVRTMGGAINGKSMMKQELFKAACCNLGESFVNNAAVDVNYTDATTGAKQIKLLGLSGTYVQMLAENLPAFRGAAMPFGLGYVPGSWMNSIQVSTGNASVKNGYEAMTGQIDVEYLKPDDEQNVLVNLFGNTMGKIEANAAANVHINGNKDLSTEILAHFENVQNKHDGNGDGFQDDPQVRQYNLSNRWFARQGRYIFHGGFSALKETRYSGQVDGSHGHSNVTIDPEKGLYRTGIETNRYEGYMKHAFVIDNDHGTNVALMGNVSMHEHDASYGKKWYWVNQKNAYASLVFETNFTPMHNLSAGLSWNHDYYHQLVRLTNDDATPRTAIESETVPGAYAQYTFNMHSRLIFMAGLRVDHSNVYGTFWTPRAHLKWMVSDLLTLRLSAGKGYRSPHVLAENNYLLASGRTLEIGKLSQEAAWNYGLTSTWLIPVAHKTLKVTTEYYYTHFDNQTVIDYDADPQVIKISDLDGKSYSHTFQIDANYQPIQGLDVTMAYRYNIVKATLGGVLRQKPLQSRYKALLSASYKPGLGLWQFDATLALNGGGRMPVPYTTADGSPSWNENYKAFATVNAQITRKFRHFDVYVGGENLTGYKQKHPIVGCHQPWSSAFDPTMIYGPVSGAMGYVGLRFNLK